MSAISRIGQPIIKKLNRFLINRQSLLFLLILITGIGFALRVWGLDFGLPNLSRPDENHVAGAVILEIFQSFVKGEPTLNPKFFYYPSFYIYITLIVDTVYYFWGQATGLFPDAQAFIDLYKNDWTSFLILQRWITAIFGTLTIPVVYLLGKNVLRSKWGGLLSALVLAVCYLHARDSHFGVTDITGTFWVTLTLYFVSAYWKTRQYKQCLFAAICAGVSASTKYPFGLVMLAVLAVEYFVHVSNTSKNSPLNKGQFIASFLKIIGTTFAVFFIISPYILIDFVTFKKHFLSQVNVHKSNPAKMETGFTYHLKFSLWHGMGFSALTASITSMFFAVRKHQPLHWILAGFTVLFYLIIGFNHYLFVRYILPIVPVLCVYTAWLVIHAPRIFNFKPRRLCSLGLILFLLLPTIYNVLWFNQLIAKKDSRSIAREFLIKQLNKGDSVGIGMMFTHIDLPLDYNKYFLDLMSQAGSNHIIREDKPPKARYSKQPVARNEFYISTYRDIETLKNLGIKYVTIGLINMPLYRIPQQEFMGINNTSALELVKRIPVYKKVIQTDPLLKMPEHVTPEGNYDATDGFFVPYIPDPQLVRPGPEIQIYKVAD